MSSEDLNPLVPRLRKSSGSSDGGGDVPSSPTSSARSSSGCPSDELDAMSSSEYDVLSDQDVREAGDSRSQASSGDLDPVHHEELDSNADDLAFSSLALSRSSYVWPDKAPDADESAIGERARDDEVVSLVEPAHENDPQPEPREIPLPSGGDADVAELDRSTSSAADSTDMEESTPHASTLHDWPNIKRTPTASAVLATSANDPPLSDPEPVANQQHGTMSMHQRRQSIGSAYSSDGSAAGSDPLSGDSGAITSSDEEDDESHPVTLDIDLAGGAVASMSRSFIATPSPGPSRPRTPVHAIDEVTSPSTTTTCIEPLPIHFAPAETPEPEPARPATLLSPDIWLIGHQPGENTLVNIDSIVKAKLQLPDGKMYDEPLRLRRHLFEATSEDEKMSEYYEHEIDWPLRQPRAVSGPVPKYTIRKGHPQIVFALLERGRSFLQVSVMLRSFYEQAWKAQQDTNNFLRVAIVLFGPPFTSKASIVALFEAPAEPRAAKDLIHATLDQTDSTDAARRIDRHLVHPLHRFYGPENWLVDHACEGPSELYHHTVDAKSLDAEVPQSAWDDILESLEVAPSPRASKRKPSATNMLITLLVAGFAILLSIFTGGNRSGAVGSPFAFLSTRPTPSMNASMAAAAAAAASSAAAKLVPTLPGSTVALQSYSQATHSEPISSKAPAYNPQVGERGYRVLRVSARDQGTSGYTSSTLKSRTSADRSDSSMPSSSKHPSDAKAQVNETKVVGEASQLTDQIIAIASAVSNQLFDAYNHILQPMAAALAQASADFTLQLTESLHQARRELRHARAKIGGVLHRSTNLHRKSWGNVRKVAARASLKLSGAAHDAGERASRARTKADKLHRRTWANVDKVVRDPRGGIVGARRAVCGLVGRTVPPAGEMDAKRSRRGGKARRTDRVPKRHRRFRRKHEPGSDSKAVGKPHDPVDFWQRFGTFV